MLLQKRKLLLCLDPFCNYMQLQMMNCFSSLSACVARWTSIMLLSVISSSKCSGANPVWCRISAIIRVKSCLRNCRADRLTATRSGMSPWSCHCLFCLQAVRSVHCLLQIRYVQVETVLSFVFGCIHRRICVPHQDTSVLPILWISRNPDTCRYVQLVFYRSLLTRNVRIFTGCRRACDILPSYPFYNSLARSRRRPRFGDTTKECCCKGGRFP